MALTLDATVGGANANSYVTRAQANSYFEGRLQSDDWTGTSDAAKDQALVAATARLEQETYLGLAATDTQRLKWPRLWVLKDDGASYWPSDAIPRPVQEAAYEVALALLGATTDPLADTGLEGFDSVTIGPISVTPTKGRAGGELPAQVHRLLRGMLQSPGGTVRLERA